MKKLFLLLSAAFLGLSSYAQAPQKMSYQAIIRTNSGTLLNAAQVGTRVSILQGSATGAEVFSETHSTLTNSNGLLTLDIGTGTPVSGSFSGIDWSNGPYFIKTETDPNGGSNYTITGSSELMSVPYALFAANGTPGPQGPEGLQGETGATGPQGPQGVQGETGPQGLQGETGATGPQGVQGETGATGPQGPMGMGMPGMMGMTGPQGPQGETGPQGLQGNDGATGPQGLQGETGATGPQGPMGMGMPGMMGMTGPQGPQGEPGPQGLQGNDGATGPQGLQGETGATGPQGIQGETGATGPMGATGPQGPMGMGMPGMMGMTGPQGPQGETGATGSQGPQGAAGLLTAGSAAGNTSYWNGTTWVTSNSNIYNNGANVGIGTNTPSAKLEVAGTAKVNGSLDVNTTTGGLILPRLTTTQIAALSPVPGMVVFNTSTVKFQGYAATVSPQAIDQANAIISGTSSSLSAFTQSQSFVAGTTGALTRIDIMTGYVYANGSYNYTLKVFAGAGTGGTLLGTQTVLINTTGINGLILSPGINLVAGNTYTFMIQAQGAADGNIKLTTGDTYTSGIWYNNGSTILPDYDLYFNTYITPAMIGGWVDLH